MLAVRSLDSLTPKLLPGTEVGYRPFWSPDSQSIASFSFTKLSRVDLSGGRPRTLATWPGLRGTWSRQGVVLFGGNDGRLYRVSSDGGVPTPVTETDRDPAVGVIRHTHPQFLPDGNRFLYVVQSPAAGESSLFVGALDSTNRSLLLRGATQASYASGHLVFVRAGDLYAQKLRVADLELVGEPTHIAQLGGNEQLPGFFSVSDNGVLAYTSSQERGRAQLTWFDREGVVLGSIGELDDYLQIALAPDESRVAASIRGDLWLLDLKRDGIATRITFNEEFDNGAPQWSPDGRQIVFTSRPTRDLYRITVGDGSEPSLLLESDHGLFANDWSSDGRLVSYLDYRSDRYGLWVLPLSGDQEPFPLTESSFLVDEAQFSPDVEWIAYNSDESGQFEVYVQSVRGSAEKVRVSTDGGSQPKWRGDGKELFYFSSDSTMMAVAMDLRAGVEPGIPQPLFNAGIPVIPFADQYRVTSDGQRFLVIVPIESPPITVVTNWTDLPGFCGHHH